MRDDEELLTGDVAARVTAAARAKEPNATIERVETDSEAHMVREDGTRITVQIDRDYAVTNLRDAGPVGPWRGFGGTGGAEPPPSATTCAAAC